MDRDYIETLVNDCDWNIDYHLKKVEEFKYKKELYAKDLKRLDKKELYLKNLKGLDSER